MPLWVKQTETPGSGNPNLVELGGRWLEDLDDPAFATQVHCRDSGRESNPNGEASCQLPGGGQEKSSDAAKQVEHSLRPVSSGSDRPSTRSREIQQSPKGESIDFAEELYRQVRLLVPVLCAEPKRAGAIADALGVTKPTADAWIRRLVQEKNLGEDCEARELRYPREGPHRVTAVAGCLPETPSGKVPPDSGSIAPTTDVRGIHGSSASHR